MYLTFDESYRSPPSTIQLDLHRPSSLTLLFTSVVRIFGVKESKKSGTLENNPVHTSGVSSLVQQRSLGDLPLNSRFVSSLSSLEPLDPRRGLDSNSMRLSVHGSYGARPRTADRPHPSSSCESNCFFCRGGAVHSRSQKSKSFVSRFLSLLNKPTAMKVHFSNSYLNFVFSQFPM